MDLGIPKCALTGCPNKSKFSPQAFKLHLEHANINFRDQLIPTLNQHEPYVYLGINLVPSLKWKIQTHITTTKLAQQCTLLTSCPATMKQKIQMINTVIRAGIAYSFYAVPYSLPAIKKLDKKVLALHKNICGLPKCMSNAVTQLPQVMFGMEAFSLKNAYTTCIGEQLINALNDKGRLGKIYNGLTNYILAKHGGSLNLPRITQHDCIRSPITRTLYLLKTTNGAHLKSTLQKFPLLPTPLETQWLQQTQNLPTSTPTTSLKYLHNLILHNITELKHITHSNGTRLMTNDEFKTHYVPPTKTTKAALNQARILFCEPPRPNQCPNTLKDAYQIPTRHINTRPRNHNIHPPPPPPPEYPKPPPHILKNYTQFPLHSIIKDRSHTHKDKNKITKEYTSYLCQWILPNESTYNKWLPQRDLFPWESQNTINHNLLVLTQYYTHKQYQHFTNIIKSNFDETQTKDSRHIPPPQIIPLCQINIHECNPDSDIACTQPTIQSQHGTSHIYDEDGRHIITIPEQRLQWLWEQYQNALPQSHNLEPPTQSFEKEVVWLYQRYKYRLPKNDPLKLSHYTLPHVILDHIIDSFQITHSHFSSPVTCPTSLRQFSSPFLRDKVFGSIGKAFQHKWIGNGYAHPHSEQDTQQALHWARLAAQNDPSTITILINTDPDWYHNLYPHNGPFPDSHVITLFKADTITYDEPTIPPELQIEPRIENRDIQVLCIHHKTSPPRPINYTCQMDTIGTTLQLPTIFTTNVPPTPFNTIVNRSKKWSQLAYPPSPPSIQITNIPLPTNHNICLPLKYQPQFCYYTDGSFIPPKAITQEHWRREKAGYGIYNPFKNLNIAERLPGLQNILRAELMAIHHTLRLLTTTYRNEPAHIFTDCLNVLYLINTQTKHPTTHNSHPDKKILESIVKMLQDRTQTTTLHKVKAHTNISGNEQADKLAKMGCELEHRDALETHEHAHPTPYYFHKKWWHSMQDTPDKGPIRHLGKYILKYDNKHNLTIMASQTHQLHKWLDNNDIDKPLSNAFWNNPIITDKQKTCLVKFRTGQYMGHARKQLFFGRTAYPSHTCPICNSSEADTWLHVLLKCKQQHIHALITNRHNKAVWEIRKLLISNKITRYYTLMNAGIYNDSPQENTVPTWLLPCTCDTQRCHCNARLKPDILCVIGHPYNTPPPETPTQELTIQYIEFTYCNDRFAAETLERKTTKYQPLINTLITRGWNVAPLIVLASGARATTHIPSMKALETQLKLPTSQIRHTFQQINTIAIQYAHSILIHKRRIENKQSINNLQTHT